MLRADATEADSEFVDDEAIERADRLDLQATRLDATAAKLEARAAKAVPA
jgi:hypothetical protein